MTTDQPHTGTGSPGPADQPTPAAPPPDPAAPAARGLGRFGRAARRARHAIPAQRGPQHLRAKEPKRPADEQGAPRPAEDGTAQPPAADGTGLRPAVPQAAATTDQPPASAADTKPAVDSTAKTATEATGAATRSTAEPASSTSKSTTAAAGSTKTSEPVDSTAQPAAEPTDSSAGAAESGKRKRPELPSTRPPGAPPDPWTAFAQTGERPPGRWQRGLHRAGRVLRHEYAIVIYGALLLAVALTWPALRYPLHTVPQDIYDPARQAWQVAWAGHILLTEPARLWQGNAFFPEHYSYAFGDSLLGYAPFGMLGSGPGAAILRYNILFVLAHALLAIGAYALIRQLGAGRTGATVGAIAFAYAPWRLAQEGHLDIISAGGIPLALAMLLRGHGYSLRYGFRPDRRRIGWAVAGWAVAIWQITLGFSLGLPFAYALLAIALTTAVALLVRRLRTRRISRRNGDPAGGRSVPAWFAALPWRRKSQVPGGKSQVPSDQAEAPARTMQDTLVEQPGQMVVLREGPEPQAADAPKQTSPTAPANAPASPETVDAPKHPESGAATGSVRQEPVLGWRLLLTDLLGFLIMAGVGALIALPYLRVGDTAPAGTEISFFSPPVQALLIGPAESRIWGAAHAEVRNSLAWPAEMSLLPGFALYALALAGLIFSVWRRWQRLVLLAGAVVAAVLALGTTVLDGKWTYLPLFGHFPSSLGLRIPGRLMLWVTLLLAILAAGAVAEFVRRVEQFAESRFPPWPGPWLRLATFVPVLLVLVEGWNATAHPVVPAQPAAMRTVSGPMLVLPTAELSDQTTMLWSTSRFQQVANGSGGFAPARQIELRRAVATFPDAASIDYLRGLGIGTVLLLRPQAAGTPWERAGDLPVDNFGITRQDLDANTVIFRLDS
ncbi:hypothetical protein [Actinoplanes sp. RD1]|uniref:hypothetical protein n=1 Tax=Actinoplanes sp. RD1 TaxID=3064538 RepID=UPI00274293C1|nr:hypothetical protein [Actinoplanes sp. RD1]